MNIQDLSKVFRELEKEESIPRDSEITICLAPNAHQPLEIDFDGVGWFSHGGGHCVIALGAFNWSDATELRIYRQCLTNALKITEERLIEMMAEDESVATTS